MITFFNFIDSRRFKKSSSRMKSTLSLFYKQVATKSASRSIGNWKKKSFTKESGLELDCYEMKEETNLQATKSAEPPVEPLQIR